MQLSTVKRERLIPPVYLISIALLLTVAFIVLLPSRETFTRIPEATPELGQIKIDDLDVAYIRANDAAGTLSNIEMGNIISALIRSKRWQDARSLMADRPEAPVSQNDLFLLDLETAREGYVANKNEAGNTSYAARLISLLTDFLDMESLHDVGTLTRAAQISEELKQPELSASYHMVMATADPKNAVTHFQNCAHTLARNRLPGQAESCYRSAIAKADPMQRFELSYQLINLLNSYGDSFAATNELEQLVQVAPQQTQVMSRLAGLALSLERPDLAYPLYAHLSSINEERAVYWLEKAATWSEASNLPGLSAEYVASIIDLSDAQYHSGLNKRRQALLLAAGRNEEALQTVHARMIADPDSAELLLEGINLASGMGLTAQAMTWNERLLEIRPYDLEGMQRQIDFSLATSQLGSALQWARKGVELDPFDKEARVKLAQLEEWNGNVQDAQQQRVWLASNYPSTANDIELIRLSELNWDSATAAKTLQKMAKRQPISHENILKLVALHEADGRPDLAAQALVDLQNGGAMDAMLIRELATLNKRHGKWKESLQAWQTFAARYGRSSEESVNRMELHWRLDQPELALDAAGMVSETYLASASTYQLELMSTLGWRYRKPQLVLASAPYLERLNIDDDKQIVLARRVIRSYLDQGNPELAIGYAEHQWRSSETNDNEFLMTALDIALKENVYPHLERYLDANGELLPLRDMPSYWLTVAAYYNRQSDTLAALETYENTLLVQPDSVPAMTGILWTLMGDQHYDEKRLADTLEKFETAAIDKPELWSPFAVGHMRLKQPEASLRWFSKIMLKDDHDYNILLSFADALEQTGNTPHAFKVRQYTLSKLRPLVLAETSGKTDALARDYISLLRRYGSSGENEAWTQRLLAEAEDATGNEAAWRQEMAAAWYLSTQRHDYARLILTKMHEKRLESPAWQQLALAVADNNRITIEEILASGEPLSTGDRILALRTVGKEKEAFALAQHTMEEGLTDAERRNATDQVISMRYQRPGYYAGGLTRTEVQNLNITETGLSLRHTLAAADLGFSVDYHRRQLELARATIQNDTEDDLAVTAHFGNSRRGGSFTAGLNSRNDGELNYSGGQLYLRDSRGKKELSTEVYINEITGANQDYRIAAKRDRAELAYSHKIGKNEFVKVSGSINEISTRLTDDKVSTDVGASIELRTIGTIGSNSWSMGVAASQTNSTSAGVLGTTSNGTAQFSAYTGEFKSESQELSLNAALFRGGIQSAYPQAASPRYHVSARLGHNWQAESTAFNVAAGAGFRVLGNDELSFNVEHDTSFDESLNGISNSIVGVQYRNHF